MGYEGDRRYGRDQDRNWRDRDEYQGGSGYSGRGYGQSSYSNRDYGRSYGSQGGRDYGRQPQGYDYDDRGFFDRAGDEVRSWFGDEEAERRRRYDEQMREREEGSWGDRSGRSSYGGGSSSYGSSRGQSYAERALSGYGSGTGDRGGGYSSSDYGAGRGAGATGNWGLGAGSDRNDWGHDPNYRSWRDRQIQALDRDYDDYRREHQSKFDSEFHGWRQSRQTQRDSLKKVREHQEVVGSDGQHVGTVDKVRGDRIILTKNDQDASGHHHSIPCSWVQSVDDKVTINKTADQAQQSWKDEENNSAFGSGNSDRSNSDGPQYLNRSFSGTY